MRLNSTLSINFLTHFLYLSPNGLRQPRGRRGRWGGGARQYQPQRLHGQSQEILACKVNRELKVFDFDALKRY